MHAHYLVRLNEHMIKLAKQGVLATALLLAGARIAGHFRHLGSLIVDDSQIIKTLVLLPTAPCLAGVGGVRFACQRRAGGSVLLQALEHKMMKAALLLVLLCLTSEIIEHNVFLAK